MTQIKLLSGFLILCLVLLAHPIHAKIVEKETVCGLQDCYSIFSIDQDIKAYEGLKYDVASNAYALGTVELHIGKIDGMKIEVLKGDLIKVSGSIGGATNNLWGFSMLGDTSHLHSTWWNSSWLNCKNITIEEKNGVDRVNEPVNNHTQYAGLNMTGLTLADATNEIRVVDTYCGNGGNTIDVQVLATDDSTYAEILFLADVPANSNATYSMYYNNPAAGNPGYAPILLDWDYFDVNTSAYWTVMTGGVAVLYDVANQRLVPNPSGADHTRRGHDTDTLSRDVPRDTATVFADIRRGTGDSYGASPVCFAAALDSIGGYGSHFNIAHPGHYTAIYDEANGELGGSITTSDYAAGDYNLIRMYCNGTVAGVTINVTNINNSQSWAVTDSNTGSFVGYSGFYSNRNSYFDNFEVYNMSVNRYHYPLHYYIGEAETEPIIPVGSVTFDVPTPDNGTTVGFDYSPVINLSFTNNTGITAVYVVWDGTTYNLTPQEQHAIFTPNLTAGHIFHYTGYVNILTLTNNTGQRALIVSTFTQDEIDSRFDLSDLTLILLLLLVGIMAYVLIRA